MRAATRTTNTTRLGMPRSCPGRSQVVLLQVVHAPRAAGQHHNVRAFAMNADMQRDVVGRLHY